MHITSSIIIFTLAVIILIIVIYFNVRHERDLKSIEKIKLGNAKKLESITKSFNDRFEALRVSVIENEINRNRQWAQSEDSLNMVLTKTRDVMETSANSIMKVNNILLNNISTIKNNTDLILKEKEDGRK